MVSAVTRNQRSEHRWDLNLTKRKLIIVTTSYRVSDEKSPIPAIERYDGVYFRLLKKYKREGKLRNIDILILSERDGLIWTSKRVPYYKPRGIIGALSLDEKSIEILRKENVERLEKITKRYTEAYVNVGRQYMKLLEGIENLSFPKITYSKGNGLGAKAAHMKNWILSQ